MTFSHTVMQRIGGFCPLSDFSIFVAIKYIYLTTTKSLIDLIFFNENITFPVCYQAS